MAVTPGVHAAVAEAVSPHAGELFEGALDSVMPLGEMLERYLGRGGVAKGANGRRARSEEDKHSQRQPRDALTTDVCRIRVKFGNLADAIAGQAAVAGALGPPLSIRHVEEEHDHHDDASGSFKGSTLSHRLVAVHRYEPYESSNRPTTWGELIDGVDPRFYSRVEEEAASDWPVLSDNSVTPFLPGICTERSLMGWFVRPSRGRGGGTHPSATSRRSRLLRSVSADVRSSDDVIAFAGPTSNSRSPRVQYGRAAFRSWCRSA